MASDDASFDAEFLAHTASLFAAERSALAPEAVETLARTVVRRVASVVTQVPRFEDPVISEESLSAFCEALVQVRPTAALQFIEERQTEGVSQQSIYLGYICGAARRLGEGWDENRFTFLEVTLGTGHLYALMRVLRTEGARAQLAFEARRLALFATVPGEDHGIGITVAADLFRNAGWTIDLKLGMDHDELVAHIERTRPATIGLSLSTESRLENLIQLVATVRVVLPHAIIGVAPAASLDEDRVRSLVDVDLLFQDARAACVELDRLIRLRG